MKFKTRLLAKKNILQQPCHLWKNSLNHMSVSLYVCLSVYFLYSPGHGLNKSEKIWGFRKTLSFQKKNILCSCASENPAPTPLPNNPEQPQISSGK